MNWSTHRSNLRFGKSTVQAGVRGSLPGLSKTPGALYEQQDWNGRYHLFTAKAAFEIPFDLGAMRLAIATRWSTNMRRRVPSTEYMRIGGRQCAALTVHPRRPHWLDPA